MFEYFKISPKACFFAPLSIASRPGCPENPGLPRNCERADGPGYGRAKFKKLNVIKKYKNIYIIL